MLKYFQYFIICLIIIEVCSYIVGVALQKKRLIYHPAQQASNFQLFDDYEDYLKKRDPLLGWPYPSQLGEKTFDTTGARHTPSFPDVTQGSCVSLYGDSYTMGTDVDHDSAWGNALATLLECRVANYGVGGYGIDQAYLRFQNNREHDQSKFVILGHSSVDVLRNLSRLYDFFAEKQNYAFKPRFILNEQQELELIPIPELSEQEYLKLIGVQTPFFHLEHEPFALTAAEGMRLFQFPYSISLTRAILQNFRLQAKLADRPAYMEFFTPQHRLQSLELSTAIIKAFYKLAEQRGQLPIILFFANQLDMVFYRKHQVWTYQPLLDALDEQRIPYLNFGIYLADYIGDKDVTAFYKNGHYNEEINQVVAEFVNAYLRYWGEIDTAPSLENYREQTHDAVERTLEKLGLEHSHFD